MHRPFISHGLASLAAACLLASAPLAANPETASNGAITFAFALENDVFSGTDRNYTNGTKLSWDYAEAPTYDDIDSLPAWTRPVTALNWGMRNAPDAYGATISLGQSIFTPENKEATELIEDDRPYAGWTYLSLALRERHNGSVDSLEFTLGVVGPDSFAEDIQNWVHEQIGSTEARGWDNQLKNEVGGILAWRRDTERLSLPDDSSGWGADLATSYGLALGNVYTYAHAGANVRFGYNRQASVALPRIRAGNTAPFPSRSDDPRLDRSKNATGFFLTVGAEGRYVARNLFIEGNTWADSHGLDLEPWVADLYAGISFLSGKWSVNYVYTWRSEEFPQQDQPHEFGGLTIARTF